MDLEKERHQRSASRKHFSLAIQSSEKALEMEKESNNTPW